MKPIFSFIFLISFTTVNLTSSEISNLGDKLYNYLLPSSVNKRSQNSFEKSSNNADIDVNANDELRKKYVLTERPSDRSKSKGVMGNILSNQWRSKEDNGPKSREPKIMKLMLQSKDNFEPLVRHSGNDADLSIQKRYFHIDPVLNEERRRPPFRRRDDSSSSSSSRELKEWKDEFKELWMKKKFEALNASTPAGDTVNMVAARPWGVPCGDPNQHDMPWGTCVLGAECEPEFRIYRGDYLCGRTSFVCCAIQTHTFDMYQGFDVSFSGKSLSTDSEEKRKKGRNSKSERRKKRRRERRHRKEAREKRLKKIRRHIKKIAKEVKTILNRQYRNASKARKKKTKQISNFVKDLKKQYKKDKKAATDLNELYAIQIDSGLHLKLKQLKATNHEFNDNATFRDIVVNGSVSRQGARMLIEAYPELVEYEALRQHGFGETRRNDEDVNLEYDIEYGYLYS